MFKYILMVGILAAQFPAAFANSKTLAGCKKVSTEEDQSCVSAPKGKSSQRFTAIASHVYAYSALAKIKNLRAQHAETVQKQKRQEQHEEHSKYLGRGVASFYADKFHGRKTASGVPFNMYALTAAHRSLPFGTRVKVHNLSTDRSVVVTINDRGPYAHGRVIDLSKRAAQALGITGVAPVVLAKLD